MLFQRRAKTQGWYPIIHPEMMHRGPFKSTTSVFNHYLERGYVSCRECELCYREGDVGSRGLHEHLMSLCWRLPRSRPLKESKGNTEASCQIKPEIGVRSALIGVPRRVPETGACGQIQLSEPWISVKLHHRQSRRLFLAVEKYH